MRRGAVREAARLMPEHALRRLELKVVRRLDGLLHGEHMGWLPGPGSELAEARTYVPGEDDVRHMDWAVTARTTVPHVRDLVADRELETWAFVDLSASMDFGTAQVEKRDLAVAALGAVGFLTARLGDRFGAYVLEGTKVRRWAARSGRPALYGLLASILNTPRTETPERPTEDDADPHPPMTEVLTRLARSHPKRGLRLIVSDFLDAADGSGGERPWERPMRQLAARHQTLAVEVLDPRELELPAVGLVRLTDPETGADREVFLSRKIRARYAEAAAAQRESTKQALRRCGVPHLVLRTDSDWIYDIARFVMRQRRVAHLMHRRGL